MQTIEPKSVCLGEESEIADFVRLPTNVDTDAMCACETRGRDED